MFHPVDFGQIQLAFSSTAGWIEFAIVLACALVAWMFDVRFERGRAARASSPSQAAMPPGFAHALFPLIALALIFVVRSVYRRFAPPVFLDIAVPLALALAGTRALIYALRRVFPKQRWLAAWERGLTIAVLLMLVLHYVGVLPDIAAELNKIVVPIGKSRISLLEMLQGLLLILVTLIVTLWISGLIEQRLMLSETLEGNLRLVLAKFVRAVLLLVGVLLALQAVGIELTVLSVFGGALGVGIGLGLQKLASNYIAGFAILLDRSIRIGDVVTVDNRYGTIARVTSRYVVVRSLDGVESIVPNETLVTTTILHHTYTTKEVRVAVGARVTYDSDVDKALAMMEEFAATEPRVLRTPAPRAFVVRIAETGVELELGVWINDPEAGNLDLRSALNRKMLAGFRAQSIAIAPADVRLAAAQALAAASGPSAQTM